MKKILALLLVLTLTFLTVALVGCDKETIDNDTDSGEVSTTDTEETTKPEETTASVEKKEFSNDAKEIFKTLQSFVTDDINYFHMDFEMTGAGHFIYTVAENGKYVSATQEGQVTEMYLINNVGYVKNPEVNGFIATSDSDMVATINTSFEFVEMFKTFCFTDEVERDVIDSSTAVVSDSELGGIKVTFTDKDDPNSVFIIETDSKVYEIVEDGEVIGSEITKIRVTVSGIEDGQTMRLDCLYTQINGNITLKSPI